MTRLTVHSHRPGHRSIDDVLARARARLDRVDAADLDAELAAAAVVIDIRPSEQRTRDGTLPTVASVGGGIVAGAAYGFVARLQPDGNFDRIVAA